MFGVSPTRDIDRGPYSDYRHVDLRGKLLQPAKTKAERAEVTLIPNHGLNESERKGHEPQAVGSIQLHRGCFARCCRCRRTLWQACCGC